MAIAFDQIIVAVGDMIPLTLAARAVSATVGDARLALCMHRVGEYDGSRVRADVTCPADTLDAIVTALLDTRSAKREPWLTVTFDDGYLDAVEYVRSRAPRFPSVEWIVFVCPEKAELGAGFRWDVPGASAGAARGAMNPDTENHCPQLRAAGQASDTRVATTMELRRLLAIPNAALGNHTNTHALQVRLSSVQADAEYARSIADFERLFGPQRHFAYPFGTPQHEVTEQHVRLLWTHGDFDVWTTEPRPYTSAERARGAPLPRYSPSGRWSASGVMLWIAAHALRRRLRPRRATFGPELVRRRAGDDASAGPYPTRSATTEVRA